jgi:hypothetical protein
VFAVRLSDGRHGRLARGGMASYGGWCVNLVFGVDNVNSCGCVYCTGGAEPEAD